MKSIGNIFLMACALLSLCAGCSKNASSNKSTDIIELSPVDVGSFLDIDGTDRQVAFDPKSHSSVSIKRVYADCNCISVAIDKTELLAGEHATLTIHVNPRYLPDNTELKRSVVVETTEGSYLYPIHGKSLPAIHVDDNVVNFGSFGINPGSIPSHQLYFSSERPGLLSGIVANGEKAHVEVNAQSIDNKRESIAFEMNPGFLRAPSPVDSWIFLTSKSWPQNYVVPVNIKVDISRRSVFSPDEINLGLIDNGSSFIRQVRVENPYLKDGFQIKNVVAIDGINASFDKLSEGKYLLTIQGKIQAQEGLGFSRLLTVATNDPLESKSYIKLFGAIPHQSCCYSTEVK